MFDHRRSQFAIERYRFEQWAYWCERENDRAMGITGSSVLGRMVDYRARIQAGRSVAGADTRLDAVQLVDTLMAELQRKATEIHEALLARHRFYVHGIKLQPAFERGRWRLPPEAELASKLYGDPTKAGVQRLRRLCFKGYETLQQRAAGLSRGRAICYSGPSFQ